MSEFIISGSVGTSFYYKIEADTEEEALEIVYNNASEDYGHFDDITFEEVINFSEEDE
ncbi:MAG: hypothetical protein RR623_00825 [Bacilli bacterium]